MQMKNENGENWKTQMKHAEIFNAQNTTQK